MLFAKKTFNPNDAAEATIGQAGRDIAGMLVAIGQYRNDPFFVDMVDGFRPWSEYMKAIAAITLNNMHSQIADDSREFFNDYKNALIYRLDYAEGVEALKKDLNNAAWMKDVIAYIDLPVWRIAEEVTKRIIKRSPLFKQDTKLVIRYCTQRLTEADNGLSRLRYTISSNTSPSNINSWKVF